VRVVGREVGYRDSHGLERRLAQGKEVLVSPGHHFGDARGFRIGFGLREVETVAAGLRRLAAILDEW